MEFVSEEYCSAEIVADSITDEDFRLTTMVVRLPRIVLAEFNTHRVFSRNSASSRAIPVDKQLVMLKENPFAPFSWAAEQPGMQGGLDLEGWNLQDAQELWSDVFKSTLQIVENYLESHPDKSTRLHKSLINRMLEPFMWHTIVVSSTDWSNFFSQRCSPLAQPEIRVAAELMRDAYLSSSPVVVGPDENFVHLPFVQEDEMDLMLEQRIMASVARCARVSYLNHDGERNIEKDIDLFKKLVTADPPHSSPLEHVAIPVDSYRNVLGNFNGWAQLRHMPEVIDKLRSFNE